MWTSSDMIQELKNRGKRITKQRKLMVEVIAEKKAGDFKEIFFRDIETRSEYWSGDSLPYVTDSGRDWSHSAGSGLYSQ